MSFFDKLILSFCRLGVAGLDPKAPGTWGTAIACLLAPYIFLPLSLPWRAVLLVVIFVLGGLASTRAEQLLDRKDPGEVVIDELVGVWLVLLPFQNPGFGLVLAAFAFFRLFDIWKPWLVGRADREGGTMGVMLDDLWAGLFAGLATMVCAGIYHGLMM